SYLEEPDDWTISHFRAAFVAAASPAFWSAICLHLMRRLNASVAVGGVCAPHTINTNGSRTTITDLLMSALGHSPDATSELGHKHYQRCYWSWLQVPVCISVPSTRRNCLTGPFSYSLICSN